MKRCIIVLVLCAALAATACAAPIAAPADSHVISMGPGGEMVVSGNVRTTADLPPIEGPAAANIPVDNVLVLDGEIQAAQPELSLTFPGGVQGRLLGIHIELGQKVRQGDLIAALDDTDLQKEATGAQLALERAEDDKGREQTRRETEYQNALAEAETAYETAHAEAEIALRSAQSALQQALLKTPDLGLRQAEVKLERAQDAEAAAADGYKQALDRPWEPQQVRDGLYKEWQQRITDRELAEMELENARLEVQIDGLDLSARQQAVRDAQARLDGLAQKTVKLDTDYTTYERAIADAQAKLAEAQIKLTQTSLYAPWDGIVTAIKAVAGADVRSETAILTLANVSDLYLVTTNLSEKHVSQIYSGQAAQITLRAYPDQTLTGHVETVLSNTAGGENEPQFVAYIRLDPSELPLLPGMTGRAEIMAD